MESKRLSRNGESLILSFGNKLLATVNIDGNVVLSSSRLDGLPQLISMKIEDMIECVAKYEELVNKKPEE